MFPCFLISLDLLIKIVYEVVIPDALRLVGQNPGGINFRIEILVLLWLSDRDEH